MNTAPWDGFDRRRPLVARASSRNRTLSFFRKTPRAPCPVIPTLLRGSRHFPTFKYVCLFEIFPQVGLSGEGARESGCFRWARRRLRHPATLSCISVIRLFFLLGSLARKTSAFKNVLSVSLWTGQSRGLRGRTMKMREAGRRIFVALGSSVRLSGKGARGGCRSPRAPLLTLQVTTAPLPARGPVCLVRATPPPPLLG